MAEYEPPHAGIQKEGHFVKTETVLLELHRLVSIFLASKSFADLRTEDPGEGNDPIFQLQNGEEEEISRLLLTVAITARVIDDREGRVFGRGETDCGVLRADVANDKEVPLTLREACNKIIHANKFHLDIDKNEKGQAYLNPFAYFYGSYGTSNWKATVDVIKFAKTYVGCISRY